MNVARVVRAHNLPARVAGFLGGPATAPVRAACDELGIDQQWVATSGETRTCCIVVDPNSGTQTVINEEGPRVTETEVAQIRLLLIESLVHGDVLCISGSAPPGVPDGFYAELVRRLHDRGVRVLVDTSGDALKNAWDAHPWAVAPNFEECLSAFGQFGGPEEAARYLARNVTHSLVTLGQDGAMYAHADMVWRLDTPEIRVLNAVGSGDAFVAGFLASMDRGNEPLEAVRWAIACGTANAARLEPGIGSLQEVERWTKLVTIEPC